MKKVLSTLSILSCFLIFLSGVAQGAQEQVGAACHLGQHAHHVVAGGINLNLTCEKVGGRTIFVNDLGVLHAGSYASPVAVAGQPFTLKIPIQGGTPGYTCANSPGSSLPDGFNIARGGQILNGSFFCLITAMPVPALSPETTRYIMPAITLVVTDQARPVAHLNIRVQIIVVFQGPKITTHNANCVVNQMCPPQVATAEGGTPPYYYISDTFRNGAPPMGIVVGKDGFLTGISRRTGTFTFPVCVVDNNAAQDCANVQLVISSKPIIEKTVVNVLSLACDTTKQVLAGASSGTVIFTVTSNGTISGAVGTKVTFDVGMPEGYSSPQPDQVVVDGWLALARGDALSNYASNFTRDTESAPSPANWTFSQHINGRWDSEFPSAENGRYMTGMTITISFRALTESPNASGSDDYGQSPEMTAICKVP